MAGSALVLGGGGVTGVAWELGILAGLAEARVDVTAVDLLVGTSAGAVVATLVGTGTPLADAYAAQLRGPGAEIPAQISRRTTMAFAFAALRSRDTTTFGRRAGALALATPTVPEELRRGVIASRFPVHDWPERRLLITAVDAASGEFVVFDRDAGVPLVDAVAASCAVPGVWPPVTVGDRRFIDGGMRSAANVDLAEGADRVLVIAPITTGGGPLVRAAEQARNLRAAGSRVVMIAPDKTSRAAFGRNALDPSRRGPAALAGHAQAGAHVEEVRALLG